MDEQYDTGFVAKLELISEEAEAVYGDVHQHLAAHGVRIPTWDDDPEAHDSFVVESLPPMRQQLHLGRGGAHGDGGGGLGPEREGEVAAEVGRVGVEQHRLHLVACAEYGRGRRRADALDLMHVADVGGEHGHVAVVRDEDHGPSDPALGVGGGA